MKNKFLLFLTLFLATLTMAFAQEDIKAIKKAAKKGDQIAQYKMGECFFKGEGEKQNYKKALDWYNKSAQQGNADACFQIAICYKNGYGVEKIILMVLREEAGTMAKQWNGIANPPIKVMGQPRQS